MLTISAKCMKYLLFISNFIFVLTGILLITIGLIIVRSANSTYDKVLDQEYISTASFLVFLGCYIFFVSFFGCCGAIRESHCMIFTGSTTLLAPEFSVLMAAIFIAEIVVGARCFMLKAEAYTSVTSRLNATMVKCNQVPEWALFWDDLQRDLSCCGTKNYTDWNTVLGKLPMSCCELEQGNVGVMTCTATTPELHKTPCIKPLGDRVIENYSTIGATGLGIGVVHLLGVIFSCYFAYSIQNDWERL